MDPRIKIYIEILITIYIDASITIYINTLITLYIDSLITIYDEYRDILSLSCPGLEFQRLKNAIESFLFLFRETARLLSCGMSWVSKMPLMARVHSALSPSVSAENW